MVTGLNVLPAMRRFGVITLKLWQNKQNNKNVYAFNAILERHTFLGRKRKRSGEELSNTITNTFPSCLIRSKSC